MLASLALLSLSHAESVTVQITPALTADVVATASWRSLTGASVSDDGSVVLTFSDGLRQPHGEELGLADMSEEEIAAWFAALSDYIDALDTDTDLLDDDEAFSGLVTEIPEAYGLAQLYPGLEEHVGGHIRLLLVDALMMEIASSQADMWALINSYVQQADDSSGGLLDDCEFSHSYDNGPHSSWDSEIFKCPDDKLGSRSTKDDGTTVERREKQNGYDTVVTTNSDDDDDESESGEERQSWWEWLTGLFGGGDSDDIAPWTEWRMPISAAEWVYREHVTQNRAAIQGLAAQWLAGELTDTELELAVELEMDTWAWMTYGQTGLLSVQIR